MLYISLMNPVAVNLLRKRKSPGSLSTCSVSRETFRVFPGGGFCLYERCKLWKLTNRKVQLYRRRPCGVENGVVAEEPFAPLQSDIFGTKTHQLTINVSFSPGYNILCSFSFRSHLTTNLDFYWVCAVFDSSATSCDSHVYSLALYTLYCGQSRRPLSKYDSQY